MGRYEEDDHRARRKHHHFQSVNDAQLRRFIRVYKIKNDNKITLRNLVDILNTRYHGLSLPDEVLSLKKEFISMFLCNLDPKKMQVNKRRCVVKGVTNNMLFLQIVAELGKMRMLTSPRISYGPANNSFLQRASNF